MQVPDPPPMLTRPDEYAFGDKIAVADEVAVRHVDELLRQRYSRPEVKRYTAPRNADFDALKAYYDTRAGAAGWKPIPGLGRSLFPGEYALGYERGGSAFAVVWLTPRPGSALVPVNVIRFGVVDKAEREEIGQ
ncbi:hypothetical protein LZK98_06150 [Sphingomonas cannabina]|uniref:hypothetical protein n=1 Tax=Sphingomonas cannabina TaxID=2899123 RepID=UPI001F1C9DD6|nr:hypothetical protein [Sphingomonas cannabina]UIJ46529.1 hypothetical protein LZK98_06150 [Sphingomonas cannabina]